jgi:hypothetical protein
VVTTHEGASVGSGKISIARLDEPEIDERLQLESRERGAAVVA